MSRRNMRRIVRISQRRGRPMRPSTCQIGCRGAVRRVIPAIRCACKAEEVAKDGKTSVPAQAARTPTKWRQRATRNEHTPDACGSVSAAPPQEVMLCR